MWWADPVNNWLQSNLSLENAWLLLCLLNLGFIYLEDLKYYLYFLNIYLLCVCVHMCMCACAYEHVLWHVCEGWRSQFSPSNTWDSGYQATVGWALWQAPLAPAPSCWPQISLSSCFPEPFWSWTSLARELSKQSVSNCTFCWVPSTLELFGDKIYILFLIYF